MQCLEKMLPLRRLPRRRPTESRAPAPGSPATDREILVTLYNALDGPNWEANENWLTDAPMGEWSGVTTDDKGRVTVLLLASEGLSGEIPAELGNLAGLKHLGLHGLYGKLSGQIPPGVGQPHQPR